MNRFFGKIRLWIILTGIIFIVHGCILKEFNFNENKLDTDWDLQLLVPLFYGDMEFKDFIYDWKSPFVINPADPTVQLEFATDSIIHISNSVALSTCNHYRWLQLFN